MYVAEIEKNSDGPFEKNICPTMYNRNQFVQPVSTVYVYQCHVNKDWKPPGNELQYNQNYQPRHLGPVVQNVVSLTSSLRPQLVLQMPTK